MNPSLQSVDSLQKYFQLPSGILNSTLEFLIRRGFIRQDKGLYKVNKPVLHLELDSPLLKQHHTHWRLKAVDTLAYKNFENLHYSGVISLSEEDYEWVRERLSHLLKDIIEKIKLSPDEKLACLTFDWFQV